jgi:hypothetical protein
MPEFELVPELVWANAMCPLIAGIFTTNTLASAAIATSAADVLRFSMFVIHLRTLLYYIYTA